MQDAGFPLAPRCSPGQAGMTEETGNDRRGQEAGGVFPIY